MLLIFVCYFKHFLIILNHFKLFQIEMSVVLNEHSSESIGSNNLKKTSISLSLMKKNS